MLIEQDENRGFQRRPEALACSHLIQASSDLVHWESINPNVATSGTIQFTNRPNGNFPTGFFRLKSEP